MNVFEILYISISLLVVLAFLSIVLMQFIKWQQVKKLAKEIAPYYDYDEIMRYTQYYVSTKFQNVPPSIKDEPSQSSTAKEKIIPYFLKKYLKVGEVETRFYMVLADSGMGKTAFMINLFLQYANQFFTKKYKLRLFPLAVANILEEIDKIEEDERKETVLLLDAFDEDNQAVKNYEKRLDEIMQRVKDFRKVIITCRTQFFPSAKEEPFEIKIPRYQSRGYYTFEKMYISPFDYQDIQKYLRKKYGILSFMNRDKIQKANQIVNKSPNLVVRPMLLNYIDDLIESNRNYEYTYQIYEALIDKWIQREVNRKPENKAKFKEELYRFSKEVALEIYRTREEKGELVIHADEITPFASEHNITLDDMEMKSRSLLNRRANEEGQEGQYKFSHKSILEYFLAVEAFNNKEFEKELNLEEMEQASKFLQEMHFDKITVPFFNNLKGTYKTDKITKPNNIARLDLKELDTLTTLDLSRNRLLLKDISALRDLKNLVNLNLSYNQLQEIGPIKNLKNLHTLNLTFNKIQDITPLKDLINLTDLRLISNQISEITALKDLRELTILYLNSNKISDINPLKEMRNLMVLHLSANQLTDLNAMKEIKGLTNLDLSSNHITNITPLKELFNLVSLDLSSNQITDVFALKDLTNLSSLDLRSNQIRDISVLGNLKNLTTLDLSFNQLSEISILKDFNQLEVLYLRFNKLIRAQIKELKQALPKCRIEY